jgi:GTPase
MIHCGFIGLVGLPNAGKSSLLNKLIGARVSIVSSKPQTTRQSLSGVLSTDKVQLIFLDAPGFVRPQTGLFEFLAAEFDRVIEKSELLLFLLSHDQEETEELQQALARIEKSAKPYQIVFTKADLKPTPFVLGLKIKQQEKGLNLVQVSVQDQELFAAFQDWLMARALEFPAEPGPLYDPEMISLDRTRDLVAEVIREECFERLSKEVPFGVAVIIQSFKDQGKMPHIEANILVEKENHKGILIGQGGQQLKAIGQGARAKIEELLGSKVYLGLHVSYKKNWSRNPAIMKELGYVVDRK